MDNVLVAEQLLNEICNIDNSVKAVMEDKSIKEFVIRDLSHRFETIVKNFPHLVEDIQSRIVKYHSNKGEHGKIADFVLLVDWYGMSLADKPIEYWDTNGKYYDLRMNEVINMFLMSRFNLGLV